MEEETIYIKEDDVQVDGVYSFQNTGSIPVRWSTVQFSEANHGAICNPTGERIFPGAKTVYFKGASNSMARTVHVRRVQL